MENINDLTFDLLEACEEKDVDEFIAWCFGILQEHIGFDMGIWVTIPQDDVSDPQSAIPEPQAINYSPSYDEGPAMLANYAYFRSEDLLFEAAINKLNRSVDTFEAFKGWHAYKKTLLFSEHAQPYKIFSGLATIVPSKPHGFSGVISLYRNSFTPYSDDNRKTAQVLVSHFIRAAHLNRLCHLHTPSESDTSEAFYYAVCDRSGYIHIHTPGFLHLIARHWPGWSGNVLPRPIINILKKHSPGYDTDTLIIRFEPFQGFVRVAARERKPEDTLTPQERRVWALKPYLRRQEIAKKLDISDSTAKRHIENIYRKLDIQKRL